MNSYHHQASKNLSEKLAVMAYSEDHLIEAVFMPEKRFVWAVQWHPEFSYLTDVHSEKIFREFVISCIDSFRKVAGNEGFTALAGDIW